LSLDQKAGPARLKLSPSGPLRRRKAGKNTEVVVLA